MEEVKKENDINVEGVGDAGEEIVKDSELLSGDTDIVPDKPIIVPEELPEDEDELDMDDDDSDDDKEPDIDNPLLMTDEEKHLGGGEIGLDGDIE